MIIYRGNIKRFRIPRGLILAIGNFDGVHLGHQKVIDTCINIAKRNRLVPAVLTFDPHPSAIVNKSHNKNLIYSDAQKLKMLQTFLISHLFILNFDTNLMKLSHSKFIKNILVEKFNVKGVITGENFHFGHQRKGDMNTLSNASKKYGFSYYIVEKSIQDGIEVSSSKIRELLSMGMIETANKMLGREYAMNGSIVYGKRLAENLGFKTANISLDEQSNHLMKGVYLVRFILLDEGIKRYGIANIGVRPTVSHDNQLALEVHLFDFYRDIYEQNVKVEFLRFIRPERNFENIEALKAQIMKDIKDAEYVSLNAKTMKVVMH